MRKAVSCEERYGQSAGRRVSADPYLPWDRGRHRRCRRWRIFPGRFPEAGQREGFRLRCGFEPFDDARSKFDVRFYLVAILFIIFDLEVAFLFPWAISLGDIGMFGFWSMVVFLGVLTIGFIYEWKKGALEWE